MKPVIRRAADAQVLNVMGARVTIRVRSEETGGAFSVVEMQVGPGFRAPDVLHRHTDVDWYGLVEQGEIGIDLDGETHWVREGGMVVVPRGVAFRWWNPSEENLLRWLCTYTPGGFEHFFVEMFGRLRSLGHAPTPGDMAAIAPELWARHRVETVPEPLARRS